jgi:hypothetical protein
MGAASFSETLACVCKKDITRQIIVLLMICFINQVYEMVLRT